MSADPTPTQATKHPLSYVGVTPQGSAMASVNQQTTKFLIWWTNEADAKALGENPDWTLHPMVPDYIRDEFDSRYGRAGRGRLWVASALRPINGVTWDDNRPTCRAAADCGGIVFRLSDLEAVAALPGFITDTAMNEVLP